MRSFKCVKGKKVSGAVQWLKESSLIEKHSLLYEMKHKSFVRVMADVIGQLIS